MILKECEDTGYVLDLQEFKIPGLEFIAFCSSETLALYKRNLKPLTTTPIEGPLINDTSQIEETDNNLEQMLNFHEEEMEIVFPETAENKIVTMQSKQDKKLTDFISSLDSFGGA